MSTKTPTTESSTPSVPATAGIKPATPAPAASSTATMTAPSTEAPAKRLVTKTGRMLVHMGTPDVKYPVSEAFVSDLRAARVENFFETPAPDILHCWTTDRVSAAWEQLIKHNFSSFPVLNTERKFVGFLRATDIALYVSKQFSARRGKAEATLSPDPDAWGTVSQVEIFNDLTVQTLMHLSPWHETPEQMSVTKGHSLLYALERFAQEPGLHRLAVVTDDNTLINFLCETALAEFLQHNVAAMGAKAHKPLAEFPHLHRNVISMTITEGRAIDAFNLMRTHQISGVALVNKDGVLVNNLSARDMEALGATLNRGWRLYESPANFLKKEHKDHPGHHPQLVSLPELGSTLSDALTTMVTNHVHRVYLVDKDKKPSAVLTIQDVIREILA